MKAKKRKDINVTELPGQIPCDACRLVDLANVGSQFAQAAG